jgi:hypothetical protein
LEGSDGEIEIDKIILEEKINGDRPGSQLEQAEMDPEAGPVGRGDSTLQDATLAGKNKVDPSVVSYEVLKGISDASKLPPDVDQSNREQALCDDEFIVVFGMDKETFQSLPGWKRTKLKKDHGLF